MAALLFALLFSAFQLAAQVPQEVKLPEALNVSQVSVGSDGTAWVIQPTSQFAPTLYSLSPNGDSRNYGTWFSSGSSVRNGILNQDVFQPGNGVVYTGINFSGLPGQPAGASWSMPHKIDGSGITKLCNSLTFVGAVASRLRQPMVGDDGKLYYVDARDGNSSAVYVGEKDSCNLKEVVTVPFQVVRAWKIGGKFVATKLERATSQASFSVLSVVQFDKSGAVEVLGTPGSSALSEIVPFSCSLFADPFSSTASYACGDESGFHAYFLRGGVWKEVVNIPLAVSSSSSRWFRVDWVSGNFAIYSSTQTTRLFVVNAVTGKETTVFHFGDTVLGMKTYPGYSTNQVVAVDDKGVAWFAIFQNGDTNYKLVRFDTEAIKPVRVSLTASPDHISSGEKTSLCVSAEQAASVFIDQGIGSVDLTSPCVIVEPARSTMYTATAYSNIGGTSATSSVTVSVQFVPTRGLPPNRPIPPDRIHILRERLPIRK